MSSIPYNYGKYVDDTQKLHDQGHVDAGKQVQSPASAGSRGLNKTVQFTKDPTQMKMGESITMEDIKTLISRIDRIQSGAEAVQEDNMRDLAIDDIEALLGKINDEITFLQIDQKDKESALAALGELRSVLDKYQSQKESAVREDAGLTDQQKKGLKAIAKKYKGREGNNGDFLPSGYIMSIATTGVLQDGIDGDEGEAYAEKHGFDDIYDAEENDEDFVDKLSDPKHFPITSAMMSDVHDVLGSNINNVALKAIDYLDALDESYEPFPEADEFNIEEDEDFEEVLGPLGFPEDETELFDAEYRGRKVPLNKPMRGDVKKFKVYVKDPKTGNVKKVNFGHGGTSAKRPTMRIRKSNPKARKSFRARHNCANPGPKTKARYWSCRKW